VSKNPQRHAVAEAHGAWAGIRDDFVAERSISDRKNGLETGAPIVKHHVWIGTAILISLTLTEEKS